MPWQPRPQASPHPRAKPDGAHSPKQRAQVAWYRRERPKLIAALGGKCVDCGATDELEFDHLKPRDWEPRRTSRFQRLRNYIREAAKGLLCLRCRSCNGAKGYPAGQLELLERAHERRESGPF